MCFSYVDLKYSGTEPGKRGYTWGLSGDFGRLWDQNKTDIPYGPSFHDELVVGCGFLLTTPEDSNESLNRLGDSGLDEDKYTSSLFFTYNGFMMKLYPDNDAQESILPSSILHRMRAMVSTGSEDSIIKFNFGPHFKFDFANKMIRQVLFNEDILMADDINELNVTLQKDYKLAHRETEQHWETALLNETEEQLLSELVLEFQNDVERGSGSTKLNKHMLKARGGGTQPKSQQHSRGGVQSTVAAKNAIARKNEYKAIYNKVLMYVGFLLCVFSFFFQCDHHLFVCPQNKKDDINTYD